MSISGVIIKSSEMSLCPSLNIDICYGIFFNTCFVSKVHVFFVAVKKDRPWLKL